VEIAALELGSTSMEKNTKINNQTAKRGRPTGSTKSNLWAENNNNKQTKLLNTANTTVNPSNRSVVGTNTTENANTTINPSDRLVVSIVKPFVANTTINPSSRSVVSETNKQPVQGIVAPFSLSTKENKLNNNLATKTATEVNISTAASSKETTSKSTAEKKRIAELYLEKYGTSNEPLSHTASKKLEWAKKLASR